MPKTTEVTQPRNDIVNQFETWFSTKFPEHSFEINYETGNVGQPLAIVKVALNAFEKEL